ncbi:MAG: hypothetical protein IKH01_14975 [Prevotella sp.]|nr:hypothetical protein [Prevotella sp.]MBR3081088.1 hypothetical protein [Prevotella sp.]
MRKKKIANLFESRKGHLDARVKREFVSNGIGTIPIRVKDYYEVINAYSVKGVETLDFDFVEVLDLAASVMPEECPLVLNIVEDVLSDEERETITETIQDYYAYQLGILEEKVKRHKERFILMSVGLVLTAGLLWLSQGMGELSREILFVLFWFFGDALFDYILLTGHDLRKKKRLAGRLASIKVEFSKAFDDSDYTDKEVNDLYSEIEEDIKQTLK